MRPHNWYYFRLVAVFQLNLGQLVLTQTSGQASPFLPFYIHYLTADRRGVAHSMPSFQRQYHQNKTYVVSVDISTAMFVC